MKTLSLNNLMHSSRHITLALTFIIILSSGLWASNVAAVVKTYHTDSGVSWVCGSASPGMVGILTDEPTYACASDSLVLDQTTGFIARWDMQTAYTHDTMIHASDITMWLDDSDIASTLAPSLELHIYYTPEGGGALTFLDWAKISGTTTIGSNTTSFFGGPVLVPASNKLVFYLYNPSLLDSGSFIRLGTSHDASGSIRLSIDEEDALCTMPVVNLSLSDETGISRTLTWDASSTNSDAYNIYRNGALIGTVTEQSFTDNTQGLGPNSSYTYVVRNSNTALGCEGPDASLSFRTTSDNATPASYDFGEVLVNKMGTKTFVISNNMYYIIY